MLTHTIPDGALAIGDVPADPRADEEHIRLLAAVADRALHHSIGWPGNQTFTPPPITPLLGRLLNNVGVPTPYLDGQFDGLHTLGHEWEVLRFVARLAGAPDPDTITGYVTSGGSEANRWVVLQARRYLTRRLPGAGVYASAEAHPSVFDAAEELGLPLCVIPTGADGGMDPAVLASMVASRPAGHGVIVVATDGTTMRGGSDDVAAIRASLAPVVADDDLWIHVDAALNGFLTPFTRRGRRAVGLGDGVSSWMVSGHKLLGGPMPTAVALAVADRVHAVSAVEYLNSTHTLGTSRSGLAAMAVWVTLRGLGTAGLRARARACLKAAATAERELARLGLQPFRAPESIIVEFDDPDTIAGDPHTSLRRRWNLATAGGRAHIVLVPSAIPRLPDFCREVQAAITQPRTSCA